MNLKTLAIVTLGWILFLAFIMIWYWAELSAVDRYFIIGGEILFIGVFALLGVKIYKNREIL